MPILSTFLVLLLGIVSMTAAQTCSTEIFVNHRKGLTGTINTNFTGDHIAAGLTRECIETNIPIVINSVRCFKWKVMTSGQLQLTERQVYSQLLVTKGADDVTFRSPGFFKIKNKHYSNSMVCIYNISLENCNHTTVSSSIGHKLCNDSMDYLSVYLGDRSRYLFGEEVASFADDTASGYLHAVLWSDSKMYTSRGTFELTAHCFLSNTGRDKAK